jgi:hypothetical protein
MARVPCPPLPPLPSEMEPRESGVLQVPRRLKWRKRRSPEALAEGDSQGYQVGPREFFQLLTRWGRPTASGRALTALSKHSLFTTAA